MKILLILKQIKLLRKKSEKISKELAQILAKTSIKKVLIKSHVSDEIDYLDAFTEDRFYTVPATTPH